MNDAKVATAQVQNRAWPPKETLAITRFILVLPGVVLSCAKAEFQIAHA
jgi:hypothetical protein